MQIEQDTVVLDQRFDRMRWVPVSQPAVSAIKMCRGARIKRSHGRSTLGYVRLERVDTDETETYGPARQSLTL